MKKIFLSVYVGLILIITASGQDLNFGVSVGLAFPTMKSAKSQFVYIQKSLPFEAEITDNFPAWIEYKAEFNADYDAFMIGFYILGSTTGGRISSKDYSANYVFDMNMRNVAFGLNIKMPIKKSNKTRLFFCLGGGPEVLNTDVLEEIELYSDNRKISYLNVQEKNQGFHAIFGLTAEIRFTNRISASIYTNYYFSSYRFPETTYYTFTTNKFMIFPKWNGFRSGLSVFYTIPEKI